MFCRLSRNALTLRRVDSEVPTVTEPLRRANVRLEDLAPGARIRGVLPDRAVTVVQVEWHGTQALTLTYRDDAGKVDHELLYRAPRRRVRDLVVEHARGQPLRRRAGIGQPIEHVHRERLDRRTDQFAHPTGSSRREERAARPRKSRLRTLIWSPARRGSPCDV